jgi:hypothetical protein
MLITVSGIDGSGKGTTVKDLERLLNGMGIPARRLRFRSLSAFEMLGWPFRTERAPRHRGAVDSTSGSPRRVGFQPPTLSAALTCGYVARIVAFHVFHHRHSGRCTVLDGYFYDNLALYGLRSRRERMYAALLQWLMPVPHLAILLVASPQAISERRPYLAGEFVTGASRGYARLRERCPQLVEIRTDGGSVASEKLDLLVRTRLRAFLPPHARPAKTAAAGVTPPDARFRRGYDNGTGRYD